MCELSLTSEDNRGLTVNSLDENMFFIMGAQSSITKQGFYSLCH